MNFATAQFCRAVSGYYQRLRPSGVDSHALRSLWARADMFAKLPELATDTPAARQADAASAFAPPGGSKVLPHTGGLHLAIEGEILTDFPTAEHVEAIKRATGPITIRVNSGGGDLQAAFAVHDALQQAGSERVSALVGGFCGSAATLILAAADRRRALDGSRFWIHSPSFFTWGNSDALRESADTLDGLLLRMARAYRRICNPVFVDAWLDGADHFFDAPQALACGLATERSEGHTSE